MKYYLLFFSGIYFIAVIFCGILATLFNLSSSSTVPTLMVAGFLTALKFVKREKRIPDPNERKQLIWGSIAVSFAISILLALILLTLTTPNHNWSTLFKVVSPWLLLIVISFLILIEFAIFYFSYSWYAKQCLKGLEKKKQLR